jgi:SAM-dependent methyltransferase
VVSLREVLGLIGAHEWRKAGVAIDCLGPEPDNRIHPHYGVYSPVRGEYLALIAAAPLPAPPFEAQLANQPYTAFDIGTGTGVVAALLARRGVAHVVATDNDPRAIRCARANIKRLAVMDQVTIQATDMFPDGLASLIVCNPPWLPARASAPIERAVYDEGSAMLLAFLNGLEAHLEPNGEGWLIMSDLAEHLGLRTLQFLADAIAQAGLVVWGTTDAFPLHRKAQDPSDPLHRARSKERTRLWRLGRVGDSGNTAALPN